MGLDRDDNDSKIEACLEVVPCSKEWGSNMVNLESMTLGIMDIILSMDGLLSSEQETGHVFAGDQIR